MSFKLELKESVQSDSNKFYVGWAQITLDELDQYFEKYPNMKIFKKDNGDYVLNVSIDDPYGQQVDPTIIDTLKVDPRFKDKFVESAIKEGFDYDENSELDQLLWDQISMYVADGLTKNYGINEIADEADQDYMNAIDLLVKVAKMSKDKFPTPYADEAGAGITESLKLELKEDFNPNFPEWILNTLRDSRRYGQDLKDSLLKKKIDLANATFIETLPPQSNRDPVLKDPSRLAVFHIRDDRGATYLYTPDGACNPYVRIDSNGSWDYKYADQLSWKWVLDHTMDYGYFDRTNPETTALQKRNDRYDAKKGSIERGKGQYSYKGYDDQIHWVTAKGEDKSGYPLDPKKYTRMLDNVNLSNYAGRLDSYFNKIEEVRSGIIEALQSTDLFNKDYLSKTSFANGRVTGDIQDAVRSLDQAIYYYRDLCTDIERIIKRNDAGKFNDDRYTVDDAIRDAFRFNSDNVRQYLKDAAATVAHIKSNPVIPKDED